MNILICCELYAPSTGGVQKVLQEIAERLVQRGHTVTIATTKLPERTYQELNGVSIKEFAISGNLVQGLCGETEAYRAFILSEQFDALLVKAAQQSTFDALWPILPKICARKVHIPCGYSQLHNPAYADYFRQMPDILRTFDHLIFYAHNYRDSNFAKEHGITRCSVVPNGASEKEFAISPVPDIRKRLNVNDRAFVFLTVGSPHFPKGHLEVAQAYAMLKLPFPSTLILNGDYPHKENPFAQAGLDKALHCLKKMRKKITGRPLCGKTAFMQAAQSIQKQPDKQLIITDLPREEVVGAFFTADLFVFASHVEYSPLVLFESAAAGLPFVSVPVGNAEEIAQWTGGGEICLAETDQNGDTHTDPSVLAKHMVSLAENKTRLNSLGKQGRKSWQQHYSWEHIARQYETILAGS
ncbi:glycosyltransferase family 4 protein [Thermodesulfobacteriota bacterium]